MGKFMLRAFITACFACESSQNTLRKVDKVMICEKCMKRLIKTREVTVRRGNKNNGLLKIIPNTNTIIHEPRKEINDLEVDT